MTVKELIEKLQTMPQDATVKLFDSGNGHIDITEVYSIYAPFACITEHQVHIA